MNTSTTDKASAFPSLQSNQYVGLLVLGALAFLVAVRMGFSGLVVTASV